MTTRSSRPRRTSARPPARAATRTEMEAVFNAIRAIVHTLHGASRTTERKLGVTSAQLFVLTQLRNDPSLSINELAERTMTHQSTVSVVVRRLVARRLVHKVRAADDGRRVELSLTPRGVALLRHAPEPVQAKLARAIGELTPTDRSALARTLGHVVSAIGTVTVHVPMLFEAMP